MKKFTILLAGLLLGGLAGRGHSQEPNTAPEAPVLVSVTDKVVVLDWESPEPVYGLFDDFESHEAFAVNSPGEAGWQYVDMDNDETYGIGDYQWNGRGNPSAFVVWNPDRTMPVYDGPRGVAHSGKQMLVSFATIGDRRNDWIISPDLTSYGFTDTITLAFWAATFDPGFGLEQIRIGHSTTDMMPDSFIWQNNGDSIAVPGRSQSHPDLYYFEYKFPADAKYVVINCVTYSGFVLCIDDIAIGTNKMMPTKADHNYLLGYNLYRDDVKLNSSLITENGYTDAVSDYGSYEYSLEAVYEDGVSARSAALEVEVPDIHQLPFVENFDSYGLEENFWILDPSGTDCYWDVDWMDGGLVDPAATCRPRVSLTNYDNFCLISKELDATGLDSVMFSYDVAGDFFVPTTEPMTMECLSAEVYDGTRWRTVAQHNSMEGNFGYERVYCDISRYVAGKKFQVRFRCWGEDAMHVIGWFVSYVKVYEKAKATIDGTVTTNGTAAQGATLTFTSQDNDVYVAVSEAGGAYHLSDVDAGTYALRVDLPGSNIYRDTMEIVKGSNTVDVPMVNPEISLAEASGSVSLPAGSASEGSIVFNNTGDGPALAGFRFEYAEGVSGLEPAMENLLTFRPSDLSQASICFDGEYFYMGNQANANIWKYDREGNFIESFMPYLHIRQYYAMAFDGLYFYVAAGDNNIYILDFSRPAGDCLIGQIATPITELKHISYDSRQDAFWCGTMYSLALIGRDGSVMEPETQINATVSGSAYDPYFADGPTLWVIDQSQREDIANPYDQAVIRRVDLETLQVAEDHAYGCEQLPGFVHGTPWVSTWGTGLFGSTDYVDGHFVLMGAIVSDPGLAFVLDMYELPGWFSLDTMRVEIPANGNYTLDYHVNTADLLDGDQRHVKVTARMDPGLDVLEYDFTLTVDGHAEYAKPLDLTVDVVDDSAARLAWKAPQADNVPLRYRVYRNGLVVDSVEGLAYEDPYLKAGVYEYAVSAVYAGGHESALSRSVEIEIYVGVACYAPKNLTAVNVMNRAVALSWLDPSATGTEPAVLRWGNGFHDDGISLSSGGSFIGAARWEPADLADYREMPLESVSFFAVSEGTYVLKIYEDGTLVHEQPIEDYAIGNFTEVVLDEEYIINDRVELTVGIEATPSAAGGLLLGIDAGPAVDGKGNVVYVEGLGWSTLLALGGSDANFNIEMNLGAKENPGTGELTADGFNVYRNGVKVNTELVTGFSYTDSVSVAGLYSYNVTAVYDICESDYSNTAMARIVDISGHSAPEDLDAVIAMNRYVNLFWNQPNTNLEGAKAGYEPFDYIRDFDLHSTGEQAIATDGVNIYTSYWNRTGEFNRYDMEGNFIESFVISGVGSIYDLAYDGRYFYGGSNDVVLYCLDLQNKTLVSSMDVTAPVRHCAYIPELDNGKGGFEIGDWTTSYFVSKTGAYLDLGVQGLDGAYGSAYHDGKLFFFQQGEGGYCELVEYDFETLEPTGNRTDLFEAVPLDLEDDARAGGLEVYTMPNGTVALLANIQQSAPRANKLVWVEAEQSVYVQGFNIFRDGEQLNAEMLLNRSFADTLPEPGTYEYTVTAIYVDGEESEASQALDVVIAEPAHCEAPIGLQAKVDKRNVTLTWTAVLDTAKRGDDMEAYAHRGSMGDWRSVSVDSLKAAVPAGFEFAGQNEVMSFFVMDQTQADPAQTGLAYSGNKALLSLAPADTSAGAYLTYADDWIIGPADPEAPIWGVGQCFSFMARGLETGKAESFKVAYSLSDDDPQNFIFVSSTPEQVYNLYTRYTYEIPSEAKYVAINYVSGNGSGLLVDDIYVGAGGNVFEVQEEVRAGETLTEAVAGYYVYRDGELLTPDPVRSNAYFDGNVSNGEHAYTVKALYNTSCESEQSEACVVNVEYEGVQTAPTNLQADVDGNNVVLSWSAPVSEEPVMLTYAETNVASALMLQDEATYYVACKWEPMDLMAVYGSELRSVAAMFYTQPMGLRLLVYQGGELVYSQDVLEDCQETLTEFYLDEPYRIDFSKDLMVGFEIEADAGQGTMIVDNGPAVVGKGDLYSEDGQNWLSNYQYTGGNCNWAMIATFSMTTSESEGFQGYLVYRDQSPLFKDMIAETTYADQAVPDGTYVYSVSAVYEGGVERASSPVTVTVGVGNESRDAAGIRLMPNPASDHVLVSGQYSRLELWNVQGTLVMSMESAGDEELDVSDLPSGLYMVKVFLAEGEFAVHKLLIR